MRLKKLVQRAVATLLSAALLTTTLVAGMPVRAASFAVEDEALIPLNLHSPEEARTASEVTLLWDKPEGIYDLGDNFKTYVVYIDGKELETSGDITTMGYSVTGLKENTTYEFTVKTECTDGTLSEASNSITVTTKPASKVLNVMDYGAVGDGTTKDTAAIQAVIDACEPGDTVLIPEGHTFLSGSLFLKSDMTLRVDGTLLGSLDLADYPVIPCMFEGRVLYCYSSLITIGKLDVTDYGDSMVINNYDCAAENITICGTGEVNSRGFIDGRQNALVQIQRNGPNLNAALGETDSNRTRGRCVAIMNAKNIYMRDVTLSYGPAWTVHSMFCDSITFDNVKFISKNEMGRVANGDGYDPESSSNVNMFNCYFCNGDDAIAIKCGKNLEGVTRNKPSYNIRVTDCLIDEGYGGFVIGSEMSGGVYNVLFQNCTVKGITSEALHVKSSRVRGGYVRDIVFKDITIDGCSKHFMLNGSWGGNNDTPPSPTAPVIENILCENVVGINAVEGPMEIRGLDAANPTKNITIKNCSFDGNGNALISNAENIDMTYSTKINGTVAETDTKAVWVLENCDIDEIHGIYPQHIVGRYGVVAGNGDVMFEGETIPKNFYIANGSASTANSNDASGGSYWQMNNGADMGDYVVLDLYGLPVGRYSVEYGYKVGGSRAIVQASLDGNVVTEAFDMYGGGSAMAHATIGEVSIKEEGLHQFRLDIIGKNDASSRYDVIVDYLKFVYLGPAVNPEDCEHENVSHFEAVEPLCHYKGKIEYWFCKVCDGYWKDEALTELITAEDLILPAKGGEVVHVKGVEPSIYEGGNIEYWYCEECEQYWKDEALTQLTNADSVILPALGLINYVTIEAENGTNNTGEIRNNESDTHSGGAYVGGWDNGKSATYTFTSPSAGEVTMEIYGCSAMNRGLVVTINGVTQDVTCGNNGSWTATNGFVMATVTIPVIAGENTMVVGGRATESAPNVDCFVLALPRDLPQIPYDLNEDGEVTVADILVLKQWIMSGEETNEEYLALADMNGNGILNVADVVMLRNYILEMA